MPAEILVEIFGLCSEEGIMSFEMPTIVALTQVCDRWREIAVSTPRLWSYVSLSFGPWWYSTEELKQLKYMTKLYTKRSKTAPLFLHFDTDVDRDLEIEQLDQTLAAVGCMLDASGRWHVLECTHTLLHRPALHTIEGRLPKLKCLVIDSLEPDEGTDTVFGDCPSLTSLDIRANFWLEDDFPLHQIQSLSLADSYITFARDHLRRCTNIRHLQRAHSPFVDNARNLQTADRDSRLGEFGPRPPQRLLPLSDVEISSLLRLTPTLTKLTVQESTQTGTGGNSIVTPSFLRPFTYSDIAGPFLPSLTDLSFTMHHCASNREALVAMIASRAPDSHDLNPNAVARLQSFTLVIMGEDDNEVDVTAFSGPLQCFRVAGLTMDISFIKVDHSESD
ncbi:hypothetical protein PM082_012075 [Marasmius tenuissimus]|nr:hypothetical protein PM082_012075 [Marasmius tenuissimus]